ncbi:FAS-associated factor 2-like [Liolophura sinensis]|uniref:FAS-associated factor 2-like n=1 Tax=Liolophura sinensis TaxID=3198878 RepID=UPI0031594DC2
MADGEVGDLSADQTEKLLQFQDLTGIEDIQRCREILQRHNWDIEVAVQDTFNEREGAPSVFTPPQRQDPRLPPMNLQPSDQRVFTIQGRRPEGFFQWSYFLLLLPFRFLYSTIADIFRFAYRLVRPDPRRIVTDPVGDVVSFIHVFEEQFGTAHPTFYQGTYSQALNDAKRELRFLCVYLHGDDHQDTPTFCRETLGSTEVIDFINSTMLFWACNVNSPEGYRVSQALKEYTYPFIALIVLRDNKMTVVLRIEGPISGPDLIGRLTRVMEDNEPSLVAARADRDERTFNQTLRQQQDEAYRESLRADQEKERKKREEKEEKERVAQLARNEELENQRLLEERERQKEDLKTGIPAEPPSDDPEAIRILLKLPSGTRLERRFRKSQSLKYLYYFVFCHAECPDDFHIVTNFPRKQLPCQPDDANPEPPTFEEVGLGKSEMLFVQDNEA